MDTSESGVSQQYEWISSRIYSLPKSASLKCILTDREEKGPQSIVLVVLSEEPIRTSICVCGFHSSYIFNLNSSTTRTCRQLQQRASKTVALFYSFSDISFCSPFAGDADGNV